MNSAPWPANVRARYLTVGGATVDVQDGSATSLAKALCTGCAEEKTPFDYTGHYLDCGFSVAAAEAEAEDAAREDSARWAQTHAEQCRAMPRPDSP
ncbi:hypothetical protein OG422_31135 (plasmid) [Streptomyces sp. NBC_01525]|uniref:hypothetical protein n=1 Tax=Streptomyces sp. NBC_01525 TaxID=2903893 RepID=UPI002F90D59D